MLHCHNEIVEGAIIKVLAMDEVRGSLSRSTIDLETLATFDPSALGSFSSGGTHAKPRLSPRPPPTG